MIDAVDYKVSWGRIARTLVDEDAVGSLCFVFDVDPAPPHSGRSSTIYLSKGPLIEVSGKLEIYECHSALERDRLATALERVRQYCVSCSYIVLVN